jgi:hypothetical protein
MRTGDMTPSGTDPGAQPNASRLARLARLVSRVSGVQGFVFIFATVAATGVGLAFTQQGLDIVGSVAGDERDPKTTSGLLSLCAGTFFLGFQAWFWARACVEDQVGPRSRWQGNLVLVWVPRILAIIPFASLTWALLHIRFGTAPWGVWALVGSGAILLTFIIARHDLTQRLRSHLARLRAVGHPRKADVLDAALDRLRPFLMGAGLVLAAVFMVLFTIDPVGPALWFGPCAIVLFAAALVIPVMTTLIQLGRKVGVRATEWIVIVMLVASSVADNHAIRLLPERPVQNRRPSIAWAYQAWRGQAALVPGTGRPIIFVAIAGGASRAGFWSGEVLSRLEEMSGGEFSRHTFAISSVSGGSVGAVGFLASLPDPVSRLPLAARVGDFTGRDFLSPVFGGGAFPDLLQRVIPVAVLPDRAQALERGWEVGWKRHCAAIGGCQDSDLLRRSFLSAWQGSRGWSPLLMINGVHEETGALILTSTARLSNFVVAADFTDLTHQDVRLSTAILNGARFPYISPGGTYVPWNGGESGHIVDGGYFDAAGVETIRQLARSLFKTLDDASSRDLRPIYLVIANADPPGAPAKPARLAPDLFGPLRGLFSAGGAHGALLTRFLEEDPPHPNGVAPQVFVIALCQRGAPMDWVLSKASVGFMRAQLGTSTNDPCGNYARMVALIHQLGGKLPGDSPKPPS